MFRRAAKVAELLLIQIRHGLARRVRFADDFLDSENRPVAPSQENLTLLGRSFLVNGQVEEFAVAVTFSGEGCFLTIGILQRGTFVKWGAVLSNFQSASPKSEPHRLEEAV